MLPIIIQDMITNVLDQKVHYEKRQFYYDTLIKIKKAIDVAVTKYETERNFKSSSK